METKKKCRKKFEKWPFWHSKWQNSAVLYVMYLTSCMLIYRQLFFHFFLSRSFSSDISGRLLFLLIFESQKFKSPNSSLISPSFCMSWWKPIGSIFKAVLLTMIPVHSYFFAAIGSTSVHFDVIYDRRIRISRNTSDQDVDKVHYICKVWWQYLLSFLSHRKISGGGCFAPPPATGPGLIGTEFIKLAIPLSFVLSRFRLAQEG